MGRGRRKEREKREKRGRREGVSTINVEKEVPQFVLPTLQKHTKQKKYKFSSRAEYLKI